MSDLTIRCLGAPEIEYQNTALQVDTRKAIALLIYLAVTDQVHTRDALAGLFWPESDQSSARGALRRTLSVLRKALDKNCLAVTRETLSLLPDLDFWLDVQEFQRFLEQTREHSHTPEEVCPACLPLLEAALELYRDDFLTGFSLRDSLGWDEWQFYETDRLRRELATALDRLSIGQARAGNFLAAIQAANRWLAADELNERAQRRLMKLYAWSGRRDAALGQYRRCVRVLDQELGVAPLEETTALYQHILEQSSPLPSPAWPDPIPEVEPVLVPSGPQEPEEEATALNRYPLVGRQEDWETLQRLYRSIAADGHFTLLEGEAGVGKTRLAEEFIARKRSAGAGVISARCYQGERELAFAPVIEALRLGLKRAGSRRWWDQTSQHWLSEAARLVPSLRGLVPDLPDPPPLTGPGAQSRLLEGICQALLALCETDPPGVVFFDDLQWADEATLSLIAYLARRLQGRPVFILASWRPEPASNGGAVRSELLAALPIGSFSRLRLSRLKRSDVQELVAALPAEGPFSGELEDRLFQESEGLPLFVIEYLKAMQEDEDYLDRTDWPVPQSIRSLIAGRLHNLSETALQVFQTASVIGRAFDEETLQLASGRGQEETVSALEELLEKGLLEEISLDERESVPAEGLPSFYDFAHEKLRSVAYTETTLVRRRLLHRRVAETLERAPGTTSHNSLAGQIAHHYRMAGESSDAAIWFVRAGDHARSLGANREALNHYKSALALGHEDRAGLHTFSGELETLEGEYQQAIASFQAGAALVAGPALARIEHKLGGVYHRLGNWDLAESQYQVALQVLDEAAPGDEIPTRVRILADWSLTAHAGGDPERALEVAHRAENLAEELDDPEALAQVNNLLGILERHAGHLDQARASLDRSRALTRDLDLPDAQIAALNNLALTLVDLGEQEEARELYLQALDLCQSLGDRHREAALHNNLADLLHDLGEHPAAMSHLKLAVSLFSEIGVEEADWEPEIWKLVEW